MKINITNRQLIIRITIVLLLGSIVSGVFFSLYLKNVALHTLAKEDAEKTSELIFEVMKTKMQEGWGQKDLVRIMKRLNTMKEGLDIYSYRSHKVEALFGDDNITKKQLRIDPILKEVMNSGKERLVVGNDDSIRFYYPMKVQESCITCHINTKVGDVNGVLDIYFPASEINIPLYMMVVYFILFLIVFLILIFVIFYFILNKKIVLPLVNFTNQIKEIITHKDMDKRIKVESQIAEISGLGIEFNNLLEQIKYYYEKLILQFYVDQMTNLPNLLALKKDIEKANTPTLIIINIDQFKNINNFYGYEAGDFILIELSKLFNKYSTKKNKFYRVSGDEFGWLKEDTFSLYDLMDMLENLEEHAFNYKESEIYLSFSCGIADSKERIIENANSSLNYAKITSKPFALYDNTMQENSKIEENIYWTQQIKSALRDDRIRIYFQPILDLNFSKAEKFETLVRLEGEDGTIYSPIHFMEVAKLSRLYLRLTRTIMKKAFEYFKDKPYEFSVNVSMDDIIDTTTRNYIMQLLQNFPEPSRVVFEILETEEITEFELINAFAQDVHKYGAKLAIDDFGSGYSNYDYVIKLNVDFLKIDSSLIMNVDTDEQLEVVVKSIIDVSKKLGLKTIAEYVHSKEVMDKVKILGVDFVQGYYIDKPLENVNLHRHE